MSLNALEQNGMIADSPLVELLLETAQAGLSGSFRLARETQKAVVYLEEGKILYAASNLKQHRLPEAVARWRVFQTQDLSEFQNSGTDFEWGARLVSAGKLNESTLRALQSRQTTEVLQNLLVWDAGEWTFTPLARLRENLRLEVNLTRLSVEAARKLAGETILSRIKRDEETFAINQSATEMIDMLPEEAFVLSRFDGALRLDELKQIGGVPEENLMRALYALWLGGYLKRFNYERIFSEEKIKQILFARIELTQTAPKQAQATASTQAIGAPSETIAAPETAKPTDETIAVENPIEKVAEESVEDFLARVAAAESHYQILRVAQTADAPEIKRRYFALAKSFHPDKFRGSEFYDQLQTAFTSVSQAYETLKDPKARELYDFKQRKRKSGGNAESAEEASAESLFEQGRAALQNQRFTDALSFLARAVQLAPEKADFRAGYAQALAALPKMRHQAEAEFLQALRIEPNSSRFRLQLAEFYVQQNLHKRAAAELNRILAREPNHHAARRLLDSLRIVG